jgi:putative nucleotidyltransferase with HDIG domain
MKIDRARAQKAFADYAAHYNAADAKVKLKIDHTYRVAALCARIAQSLALPPEDVDLAWLSGILHDVGRFEQLRRYNTFIDAQSVSHAALSVAVLFDEGRIRDYLDDAGADALLRTALEWHSAFRLPEALDDRTRLFCQILRDADKIDILRVNVETPMEEIYNVSTAPEPGDARRTGRLLRSPLRAAQLKAVPRRQRRRPCVACV